MTHTEQLAAASAASHATTAEPGGAIDTAGAEAANLNGPTGDATVDGASRTHAVATASGARSMPAPPHDAIAGAAALRGLMLYGAVLAFAGLYIYFIVKILGAVARQPPAFDGSMIAAAAALAGVLGSAFALKVGVPPAHVNVKLGAQLAVASPTTGRRVTRVVHQALSLEPSDINAKSWPLTFGVWVYAIVASAVAVTYIFNQAATPGPIRAIAVTFAGYVLALLNSAYGINRGAGQ
ncbi:MAG: hypothetical protein WBQ18_00840 [Solirubrobacteraceae bacterium]